MTLCLVFPSCIMQAVREAMKEALEMEAQQNFGDDEDDEMQEAGEVLHTEDRSFAEPTLDNPEPTVGVCVFEKIFPNCCKIPPRFFFKKLSADLSLLICFTKWHNM